MVQQVVVVGAGVTGLVAARALAERPDTEVVCLEASDHVGGQVHTETIDGARVDVGAEAIHLGAPHVAALVRELGLGDSTVGAAPGGSVLLTRKGLRPLPAGVGPAGPTKVWPVLRSGILTPLGLVRAGLEPLMARRRSAGDIAVGAFTSRRFGREVTDTFVDPLLGNLHGGDVSSLSLHSTAPQLVEDAATGTSLLLKNLKRARPAARPAAPAPAGASALPMFASWPGGLATFTEALAAQSGATIRTNAPVERLERCPATGSGEREDGRWRVVLAGGEAVVADHVLLTTPADVTARLLAEACPTASAALARVPLASVATVVLGWTPLVARTSKLLRDANGVLLPSSRVRTVKAATNLGRKWPGLASAHHLLRASVGRAGSSVVDDLDDEQMAAAVADELHEVARTPSDPPVRLVYRWPHAMPQLLPGHADRIRDARAALEAVGGLSIAGCGVDGLGIGSVVRSGQQAARQVAEALAATH